MDVTRRLREPAAWLLLAAVFIMTVSGIVDLLAGLFSPAGFRFGASSASSGLLWVGPAAMTFFAVLLATKFGPMLERARQIVVGALAAQGLAALIGVIAWLCALFGDLFAGSAPGVGGTVAGVPGVLMRFLEGGVYLALLGVAGYYNMSVLKTPELAPKPKPQAAPQQGFGQYPGAPGGYPGMQPGQTGQQQPYGQPPGYASGPQPGYPSGQHPPMAGYPSGQQPPMPGYQPQEYGQADSTSQMPSVGDEAETHSFSAQSGPHQPFAPPGYPSGPQAGYPASSEPAGSGPQFAPPGQTAQPGRPGGFGQQSGPHQAQPPQSQPGQSQPGQSQPGQGWPGGFGQEPPQAPDPYGQGGFGQPGSGGPGAFGQQPEPQQPEPQQPAGGEQQNGAGFDALFGGRPDADEPDDVQRTSQIEHDPEAFRNFRPPSGDQ